MRPKRRLTLKPDAVLHRAEGAVVVDLSGDWSAPNAHECEAEAAQVLAGVKERAAVTLNARGVARLDTLGAWVLSRLVHDLGEQGAPATITVTQPAHKILFEEVRYRPLPESHRTRQFLVPDMLADIGKVMVDAMKDLVNGIAFLGSFIAGCINVIMGRSRFRFASLVAQLERVGLRSVPIIVLISMLVGGIIAQQSVFQLQSFGTVSFVADLLGVLVLRELAVLLTSIMIAGRTGSSFTAELGSMKMREEIDALRTMGLDPIEILVVPRIVALLIGLPLLTFISSMAGLFGGGVVAMLYGGVSPEVFLSRLQNAIGINTFVVGMVKAPFMALVIGVIACIEGFAVSGSAESLGARTTASVVKSIFMVIVVDGLFAMFFASIRY
ncbi:MAG: MlaE family lipid ABC transporter permease subunit [Proteobacteria bacterium]|nr:MlaE family lipid ABC transporter permease subunit [Pseudomonadota bacterium]